jgi:hypothetical protein
VYRLLLDLGSCRKGKAWLGLETKSYKSLTRAKIQNFKTKPSFLAGPLPAATGGKGCVRVSKSEGATGPNAVQFGSRRNISL